MDGLSRRDLLKRSAVAGGLVWAAPLLSSGRAWGQAAGCCACDGTIIYAKFAPGNAQTCGNQCLQPHDFGITAGYQVDCLIEQGFLGLCDSVTSNSRTASILFNTGVTPIKLAFQASGHCYVASCATGFSVLYRWVPSTNAEFYDNLPVCPGADKKDPCRLADPGLVEAAAAFQVFTGGSFTGPNRCTGNVGEQQPSGDRCGATTGKECGCDVRITGAFMSSTALGDVLNYIEMELCITNTSKINCDVAPC